MLLTIQLKLPATSWCIARSFKAWVSYGWIQNETWYLFTFLLIPQQQFPQDIVGVNKPV